MINAISAANFECFDVTAVCLCLIATYFKQGAIFSSGLHVKTGANRNALPCKSLSMRGRQVSTLVLKNLF